MDLEVVTIDHLKKVKQGYTDQFNLDYSQLVNVFELNADLPMIEDLIQVVPPSKKLRDLNGGMMPSQIDQEKRKEKATRRKSYADKVNVFYREPMIINRPETGYDRNKK
jgi:hypothetical protein